MKNSLVLGCGICFIGAIAALSLLSGCGEREGAGSHGHRHADGKTHHHGGKASTPHGGTPVMIGNGNFHLEIVADPTVGKIQAYVLDGHLERYVQVPETRFVLEARTDGATHQIEFLRAPDLQSGSIVAKSALFEGKAEWLDTVRAFDGRITQITLNGNTFTNILFPFPEGTKHVH
jgi:hypothetical protein